VVLATSACWAITQPRCPVPSRIPAAISPGTVSPKARNAAPAAVSVSAPATAMRRSPYRSAACPAGSASSSGAMAKLAPSAPSHAAGTSSSIARYDIVGRSTNVTICVVAEWASSTAIA
jgi:hypothetical protein